MRVLKFKKARPGAVIPQRATPLSAGADLCACIEQPLVLQAGGRAVVPTGVAMELALEEGEHAVALVFGRSGLGIRHGIAPSNAVGVVDEDYRGELMVGLANHGEQDYTIQPGERIAQLVVTPVLLPEIVECEELSDTLRGQGGFGSTGRL